MKVLFVCIGNICRSPIAEGVLKDLSKRNEMNWYIESAGVRDYHIGKPPHEYSQDICKVNKINISDQKAQQFKLSDLEKYDLIYAMATDVYDEIKSMAGEKFDENKVILFLEELYPGKNLSVVDPWYGDKEGYTPVFKQIEKACKVIIEKYK